MLALGLPLGGCFITQTYQRGYLIPEGALDQIPLGASQEQVLIVFGTALDGRDHLGRGVLLHLAAHLSGRRSCRSRRPTGAWSRFISAAKDRKVQRIANYGMKDGKIFDYISRTTPSGGEQQSIGAFFVKIFKPSGM